jgi:hypothetical protein
MANPGFIKNFRTDAVIDPYRIVAFDSAADFSVDQSAGVADPIVGLSEHGSSKGNTEMRCDVVMDQTGNVEYGGDVATGDVLVSDAEGRAVAFSKAGYVDDAEVWALGVALESGKLGTIGSTTISPFLIVK